MSLGRISLPATRGVCVTRSATRVLPGHRMDEITSDISGDATSDVTWMTYAELGLARGISAASAKRLAIRRHWRRRPGNDGTARVAVPMTEATPREDRAGDDASDVTKAVTALEAAVTALREQLERAEGRADRAETAATVLRQRFEDLTAKLADAQAELAAAMDRAEQAQDRAREAEGAAAELSRADDARKGRGRWARIRAAWRGE
jgi:hypothetical protein